MNHPGEAAANKPQDTTAETAAGQRQRWADRTDHEVTDAAPADEMAVNAEGASPDRRVSPALENSRIWPDGRTVGERAPRRRIVAA